MFLVTCVEPVAAVVLDELPMELGKGGLFAEIGGNIGFL
jgi:hypothetical protein